MARGAAEHQLSAVRKKDLYGGHDRAKLENFDVLLGVRLHGDTTVAAAASVAEIVSGASSDGGAKNWWRPRRQRLRIVAASNPSCDQLGGGIRDGSAPGYPLIFGSWTSRRFAHQGPGGVPARIKWCAV